VARLIRSAGYDCQIVDVIIPYALGKGFTVYCNHMHYQFEFEDHGGRWSIKAD
jgi:hypothetical protein